MDVTKSERFEQLDRLLTEHDGMLQTAQVIASGIVKPIFYEYVKEKNLQQVAHGIYVSEDTWIDAMFLLHLRQYPVPLHYLQSFHHLPSGQVLPVSDRKMADGCNGNLHRMPLLL